MVLGTEAYLGDATEEEQGCPRGQWPHSPKRIRNDQWDESPRIFSELRGKAFGEYKVDLRRIDQRLASLEQDARQPRLAIEANVPADKKTRERTEGAAAAIQAKHRDSCYVPFTLGDAHTNSRRWLTPTTYTATRATFDQPPLWFCSTVETSLRTSIQYAS